MKKQTYLLTLALLLFSQSIYAVDIAPRISDREIIESLAELKAGQKVINERFEQQNQVINQRFEQQNQVINQRFDDIHQLIDKIWTLMMVVIAGIFGLIGYIVWDRKTALKPLEKKLEAFERDVQHDLELRHENGSLLTRLVKSLQELAKQDEKVAVILRNYSLL